MRLYALSVGFWLAGLQVTLFLALQARCTATMPSFLAVTAGWLVGSLAGLWLARPRLGLALGILAPLALRAWLESAPYRPELLPAYTLLVALSALYAGQFFRAERHAFRRPAQLFFWENNGFLLGLAVASLACLRWGDRVGALWPLFGVALVVLRRRTVV